MTLTKLDALSAATRALQDRRQAIAAGHPELASLLNDVAHHYALIAVDAPTDHPLGRTAAALLSRKPEGAA